LIKDEAKETLQLEFEKNRGKPRKKTSLSAERTTEEDVSIVPKGSSVGARAAYKEKGPDIPPCDGREFGEGPSTARWENLLYKDRAFERKVEQDREKERTPPGQKLKRECRPQNEDIHKIERGDSCRSKKRRRTKEEKRFPSPERKLT